MRQEKIEVNALTVKWLRINRRITQADVSRLLGRHNCYINRIEHGTTLPTEKEAKILAKCFGVDSIDDLCCPLEIRRKPRPKPDAGRINWKNAYALIPSLLDRIEDARKVRR
jgi:transcriptional regulator with XRE-family HTH domain